MHIHKHTLKAQETLGREIVIRIAIPENRDQQKTLPLMLVHDAQNFFDIWEKPETKTGTIQKLDQLFEEGLTPFVLVGIDTWQDRRQLDRFTDFSPWISNDLFEYIPSWTDVTVDKAGGRGDIYADFIIQKVLPLIEQEYSIGGSALLRGIGGSSMAAMISIYMGSKYNQLFSKFAFLSPALWCFEKEFSSYLIDIKPFKAGDRIYMDIGRKESSDPATKNFPEIYLQGANFIYDNLKNKAPNIMFAIDEHGEHNMPSISKRFPTALRYLWS
ncbi:MAG: alpha/beta hydrolase [Brevinema sp.]